MPDEFNPPRDAAFAQRLDVAYDFLELPVERQQKADERVALLSEAVESQSKSSKSIIRPVREATEGLPAASRRDLYLYSCYMITASQQPMSRSRYEILDAVAFETKQPHPDFPASRPASRRSRSP